MMRMKAGCVPISSDGLQVMVVTSHKHQEDEARLWTLPKGGVKVKHSETLEQAATRESFEEAGVKGSIIGRLADTIDENGEKTTWFMLSVTSEADLWPEKGKRKRKWVDITEDEDKLYGLRKNAIHLLKLLAQELRKSTS
eukprot:TRINITY_DN2233_c0_g1_i1.p1 TRINITY_DN2233_c0_g1~~TRINITY_DN2233_c0_g1_i1.p1  ORF type:complete len:140 (+),score=19.61 TRINITY_DN2233_c0_g1_i1:168-587(+)